MDDEYSNELHINWAKFFEKCVLKIITFDVLKYILLLKMESTFTLSFSSFDWTGMEYKILKNIYKSYY